MKVTFFGHSACLIETGSHRLLIDPFITGNPHAEQAEIRAVDLECDVILLTHGHADHLGDTEAIARRTGALVVATFELAMYLGHRGCRVHPMGIGGSRDFDFGRVTFTLAHHSSSIIGEDGVPLYLGNPAGLIFQHNGKTIYHAGDTAFFQDMERIGRKFAIDLALLPVGGNFTMGMDDAVDALSLLKPERMVPIHYNTFPPIQVEVQQLSAMVGEDGPKVLILGAGECLDI